MNLSKYLAALVCCLGIFTSLPVAAQEALARVKISSDCDAYVPEWWLRKSNVQYTWDGQCVDGLATGWGNLVASSPSGSNHYEGWRVAGRMLGYKIFRLAGPIPFISFWYNNKAVHLMPGMGLDIDEASLQSPSVVLPKAVPTSPRHHHQSIKSAIGEAEITTVRCDPLISTYPKKLSDYCNIGYPRGYNLTYYAVVVTNPQGKKQEYICDDFEKYQSCATIADRVTADIRASIIDFIAKAKPAIDAVLGPANLQVKLAARRETEKRAQTEAMALLAQADESKRQAQVEELARYNRESEALRLRARMDSAPAGELFALADELKEKNDLVNARVALRRFVARFPDHKLAELAARMLRELP